MRSFLVATAAIAMLAGTSLAVQAQTPGLDAQQKGSVSGSAGASGLAPGQKLKTDGAVSGTTGASGYAPGRTTIGAGAGAGAGVKAGQSGLDANAKMKGGAKVKTDR